MELSEVVKIPPYSLSKKEKESIHVDLLSDLIRHHYHCCGPYKRYLDAIKFDPQKPHDRQDLPFLPINIFKSEHLLSVASADVVRTLTSSGTSGQGLSKVYLDRSMMIKVSYT